MNFKEILDQHKVMNPDRYVSPNPEVGGWKKFVKTNIARPKPVREKPELPKSKGKNVQSKKSGRGWLHK